MKISYIVFVGMLFVSASSYVVSHENITTFATLMTPQHFFGLLGVVGAVIGAYFAKSPANGNSLLARITGNGKTPIPPDVN